MLLAKLIGKRTGYLCDVWPADGLNGCPVRTAALLMLLDAPHVERSAMHALAASCEGASIAMINADAGAAWDDFISYPAVKGVFFSDASEDHLVKGIQAIFDGEYWLPRRLLCAHLEHTRTSREPTDVSPLTSVLTRRELQTLKLLAAGNTTDHIAEMLNRSPHTVKTHIYNLFRKIHM